MLIQKQVLLFNTDAVCQYRRNCYFLRNLSLECFYQAHEVFSFKSRESQCVMNSLTALINLENINSSVSLDKVLVDGDSLYQKLLEI